MYLPLKWWFSIVMLVYWRVGSSKFADPNHFTFFFLGGTSYPSLAKLFPKSFKFLVRGFQRMSWKTHTRSGYDWRSFWTTTPNALRIQESYNVHLLWFCSWLRNPAIPRCPMYGIFTYICHIFKPNVGKYTIAPCIWDIICKSEKRNSVSQLLKPVGWISERSTRSPFGGYCPGNEFLRRIDQQLMGVF